MSRCGFKNWLGGLVLSLPLVLGTQITPAEAAIVSCPAGSVVTLEGVAAADCLTDPTLPINGEANETAAINLLFQGTGEAFVFVGKSETGDPDFTFLGTTSGTFRFVASLLASYEEVALFFKTGGGQNNPDWAGAGIWDLAAINADFSGLSTDYDGTYDFSSWGPNGLSHFSVFARGERLNLPEPTAMLIMGLGFLSLGGGCPLQAQALKT